MALRLEEIKFNHDSSSASVDAFNIRKNETEFIEVPEWRRGMINPEDSPAAYALCETRGNTLTIQARFSCEGDPVGEVEIRAIDGRLNPQDSSSLRTSVGNVLGEVEAKNINPCGEEFHTFNLNNVRIWDAGVGMQDIVWCWQFKHGTSEWIELATTTHRIYSVVRVPTKPWLQNPPDISNTQLPWVEVLNHACDWAVNSQNPDEAAELITHRVHNLGTLRYSSDGSAHYTDCATFDCSCFLEFLSGELGNCGEVNCDDCASIVSTFANAIGCDLSQMCIRPVGNFRFGLKQHIRIGIPEPQVGKSFLHHQVASEGGCEDNNEVFDCCLQVDSRKDPADPFIASLPTNLQFGGEFGYRFRLVVPDDEMDTESNTAECKRRALGPTFRVDDCCVARQLLEEHLDFNSWRHAPEEKGVLFVSEFFFTDYFLPELRLIRLRQSEPYSSPSVIQSFWVHGSDKEVRVRIDNYETEGSRSARQAVMTLLSTFSELSLTRYDSGIGDVVFADPHFQTILFASGNLVFFLRNVCNRESIPLTQFAQAINSKIRRPPPGTIDELSPPATVRRFNFASNEVVVGNTVSIEEQPGGPPDRKRLYQFLSDSGEVSLEGKRLTYRPRSAGLNTLKIYATDVRGNAVIQVLEVIGR